MIKCFKKCSCSFCRFAKKWAIAFFAGLIFAISVFLIITTIVHRTSSADFCIDCHEMDTAYTSWEMSPHGSNNAGITVSCVDCHLPPKENFFSHVTAKAIAGANDFFVHHFGDDYDLEPHRQNVIKTLPQARCTHCHSDLLARPTNSASRIAHQQVVNSPDAPESRCLSCHEDAGHVRITNLFPDTNKITDNE